MGEFFRVTGRSKLACSTSMPLRNKDGGRGKVIAASCPPDMRGSCADLDESGGKPSALQMTVLECEALRHFG